MPIPYNMSELSNPILANSKITFVSSFIYDPSCFHRSMEWRLQHFRNIAETGIQLCVYITPDYHDLLKEFVQDLPNVRLMPPVNIDDIEPLAIYRKYDDITLPDRRNMEKDGANYMCIMNSKIYFMKDAISLNPWDSTHFAWIDFNVSHVFRNIPKSQQRLRTLSTRALAPRFLSIPGCKDWHRLNNENAEARLLNDIYWRFCGGFFLGDKESILEMYELYRTHFEAFLVTHKKLVWEVNFWAWLEATTAWSPNWVEGDHNDSILNISADFCSRSLKPHTTSLVQYEYPKIESNEASNSCYIYYRDQHHLNTRYVNYWYNDAGHVIILHPQRHIITQNMHSILDADYVPIGFDLMTNPPEEELFTKEACIYGLEDIRLFESNGTLKFIATSVNHSPRNGNSMVIGDYSTEDHRLTNCTIIAPPSDTWCEKNWIPLVKKGTRNKDTTEDTTEDKEYYIYKWNPMQIGRILDNQLKIEIEYPIIEPYFGRVRGSSPFIDEGDHLVGIVHFSEDCCPRHYYHIMVSLDKETFKPLRYSDNFYFDQIGIEFCIGFTKIQDEYGFWVSKKDRNPEFIRMPISVVPLIYE